MSTPSRRRSSSPAAKTPDSENSMAFWKPQSTKKRAALSDITNQSKKLKVIFTCNDGAENSSRSHKMKSIESKGNNKQEQKGNVLLEMKSKDNASDVGNDSIDPQLCSPIAYDIYKNMRSSEAKKRPSVDFMEMIQKDINARMRAILINWLAQVSEDKTFVPETLFLTVNYIDRYLSSNSINRKQLQLLGVTCMMIAAKHEEIKAPQAEEFCDLTDYSYCKEEICQMESAVLNSLNFEMSVLTAKVFLRQFVHAAKMIHQVQSLQFECLANYLAELSLLEYKMLHYAPSLIAASAVFLAKFILSPSRKPWDFVLKQCTDYQPTDLSECVKALHHLFLNIGRHPKLAKIKEKYSQHKYKFVGEKDCPPSIPQEFFEN